MYCVYWIRLNDHTDCMTQGYIGLTKDLNERIRSHRKNKRTSRLNSFLKCYSWNDRVEIEIMDMNLTKEEALTLEAYYRPSEDIGLNHQRGGELGVDSDWYTVPENRIQHSLATSIATKAAIKIKDTPEARSNRAKKVRQEKVDSYVGISAGSKNPRATIDETAALLIKKTYIPLGMSNKEIADLFGIKPCVIANIRYDRSWKQI